MVSNVVGQLLEFLKKPTHMEAVHQGVVCLDVDGEHFQSAAVEELTEDDADIGIGDPADAPKEKEETHEKKSSVIPSQCAHWRGNPVNRSKNHET